MSEITVDDLTSLVLAKKEASKKAKKNSVAYPFRKKAYKQHFPTIYKACKSSDKVNPHACINALKDSEEDPFAGLTTQAVYQAYRLYDAWEKGQEAKK